MLICTSHKAMLLLIPLLWALLRGQLLRRCSRQSGKRGNPVHMQPLALLTPLGAPGEERCGKKDGTEGVLVPGFISPAATGMVPWSSTEALPFHSAKVLWFLPVSSEMFLPGFLLGSYGWWLTDKYFRGCTSYQGLTAHLRLYCQMWWTVKMDKWWHSWDHP